MNRPVLKYLLLLAVIPFFFSSCLDINDASYRKHNVAVILNSGIRNTGNATLSYFNEDDETLDNEVYEKVNGRDIAAFGQDMVITSYGSIYLLCTSPVRIEMINPKNLVCYTQFSQGLAHPVKMYENAGLLYVLDAGENPEKGTSQLSVYSLSTNSYIDTFELGVRAEDIVVKKDIAYITTDEGLLTANVKDAMFKDGIKLIGIKEVPAHDNPKKALDLRENGFAVSYPGAGTAVFSEKGDLTTFIKMPMSDGGEIAADSYNRRVCHAFQEESGKSTIYSVNLDGSDLKKIVEGDHISAFGYSINSKDLFVCESPSETGKSILKVYRRGRLNFEGEVGIAASRFVFFNYTETVPGDQDDKKSRKD